MVLANFRHKIKVRNTNNKLDKCMYNTTVACILYLCVQCIAFHTRHAHPHTHSYTKHPHMHIICENLSENHLFDYSFANSIRKFYCYRLARCSAKRTTERGQFTSFFPVPCSLAFLVVRTARRTFSIPMHTKICRYYRAGAVLKRSQTTRSCSANNRTRCQQTGQKADLNNLLNKPVPNALFG